MANYNPPSTTIGLIMICIVHQIAHASIIPPKNNSPQGTASGEDNVPPSSTTIPQSLALGRINVYDDETTKGPSQPWASGAHPLRGGFNLATVKSNDDDDKQDDKGIVHGRFFAVHSKASVRSTGTSDDIPPSTNKKRRIRRIMDYDSIALALRLTCEINRRLDCAIAGNAQSKPYGWTKANTPVAQGSTMGRSILDSHNYDDQYQHQLEQHQRQPTSASSSLVHVHPSQAWQRPIRERAEVPYCDPQGPLLSRDLYRSTALFDTPLRQRNNLTNHVQHIAETLEYGPIIPALALLFLDRASSVETQRGNDGSYNAHHQSNRLVEKMCPYLTPRTAHKLYLTAVILANRTIRGELPSHSQHPHAIFQDEYTQYYAELLTRGGVGIMPYELGEMMEWMFYSLGTDGLNISRSEVDRLLTSWKGLFIWEDGDNAIGMDHNYDGAFARGNASWKPQEQEGSLGTDVNSINQEIGGMERTQNYIREQEQKPKLG